MQDCPSIPSHIPVSLAISRSCTSVLVKLFLLVIIDLKHLALATCHLLTHVGGR